MEDFNVDYEIDFEDTKLSLLLDELRQCFLDKQKDFAMLCITIHQIWSYCKGSYFKAKDNEYYNSYKLLAKFGFDKKAVSRYKVCFERFVDSYNRAEIIEPFDDFSPSKLFELLPLSQDTAINAIYNKLIRPDMTVKEIREFIKTLKNGASEVETVVEDNIVINEEEIPMAYDPTKEYEYSYFETKTKNQLLNIIVELQKAYQKLKKKVVSKR